MSNKNKKIIKHEIKPNNNENFKKLLVKIFVICFIAIIFSTIIIANCVDSTPNNDNYNENVNINDKNVIIPTQQATNITIDTNSLKKYVNTNDFVDLSFFTLDDNENELAGNIYIIKSKEDFKKFFDETGHSPIEKEYFFYNKLEENDFSKYTFIVYYDTKEDSYIGRNASLLHIEKQTITLSFETNDERENNGAGYWTYILRVKNTTLNGNDINNYKFNITID